jgi:hypothetical protein
MPRPRRAGWSAAVRHAGASLDFGGGAADLPLVARGGAAVDVASVGLTLAAEAVRAAAAGWSLRAGGEKRFGLSGGSVAALRAGWRNDGPSGNLQGLSAGGAFLWRLPGNGAAADRDLGTGPGWMVRALRFEYAWTPMGELGTAHWLAVGFVF